MCFAQYAGLCASSRLYFTLLYSTLGVILFYSRMLDYLLHYSSLFLLLFCILEVGTRNGVLNPIPIFPFLLYSNLLDCTLLYSSLH